MTIGEWVSEWVIIVLCQESIFQLYYGKNKWHFDEMMMMKMSALYKIKMLSWIIIVLAHWNNSPLVDMSLHLDTLGGFRATQYLLILINAAYLGWRSRYQFFNLWFDSTSALSHTWEQHANYYTTDAVCVSIEHRCCCFHLT